MARSKYMINEIVNVDSDGEITVLNYVFIYKNGLKDAVGTKFYPVSKSEYDERTEKENVINILKNSFDLEYAECSSYNDMYNKMIVCNEIDRIVFDLSYSELWDYLRDELDLSEDDAYLFDCSRCFNMNYQGNVNPELSKLIREYETKI